MSPVVLARTAPMKCLVECNGGLGYWLIWCVANVYPRGEVGCLIGRAGIRVSKMTLLIMYAEQMCSWLHVGVHDGVEWACGDCLNATGDVGTSAVSSSTITRLFLLEWLTGGECSLIMRSGGCCDVSFQMGTGSSLMMGSVGMTWFGAGLARGVSPGRNVRSNWIALSFSGGAS
jgi:hypothetical protein